MKTTKTTKTRPANGELVRADDPPPRECPARFYLIPESIFRKLQLVAITDEVQRLDSGDTVWDLLFNQLREGFDYWDLSDLQWSGSHPISEAEAKGMRPDIGRFALRRG